MEKKNVEPEHDKSPREKRRELNQNNFQKDSRMVEKTGQTLSIGREKNSPNGIISKIDYSTREGINMKS